MRHVQAFAGRYLAALCMLAFLVPTTINAQEMPEPDAPWRAVENADFFFLRGSIDHQYYGLALIELCHQRTVDLQLQGMCESVEESFGESRGQMQSWLNRWYGHGYSPELSADQNSRILELEGLPNDEFEYEFLRSLLMVHTDLLKDSGPCAQGAEHEELTELCVQLHSDWQAAATQLSEWLCAWYDDCGGNAPIAVEAATWSELKALYE